MTITYCDACGRQLRNVRGIVVRHGGSSRKLCDECARAHPTRTSPSQANSSSVDWVSVIVPGARPT